MKLSISKENSKMGKVCSVSLTPHKACPPDVPCKKSCYAWKIYFPPTRKPVRTAWDGNLAYAVADMAGYFGGINAFLHGVKKPKSFFRWHVGGDILNQEYLSGMKWIAQENVNTNFLAFTKNHSLDFNGLPDNLVIIASMWPGWGDPTLPLRKAWMQDGTENRIPEGALECQGGCDNCGLCWHLPSLNRDVVFHKH